MRIKEIKAVTAPYPFESYTHVISPLSPEEGGGFLISFPDLPGCMSDGETIEEAIQKFQQLTYQELLTLVLVTKRLPKRIDQKIKDYYCSENIRTEAMTAAFLQDAKVLNWGHVLD